MAIYSDRDLQLYSHLELLARQAVEGYITGLHRSPFHGFSVEFSEHRQYNPGESTRFIDWKLYARTDRLYVKRFEEETNLRCQLILDVSSSMYFPFDKTRDIISVCKLNYGVFICAVLIYLLRLQRDAFGLTLFDDSIQVHTPARSTVQHYQYVMRTLDQYVTSQIEQVLYQKSNLVETLHDVAERIHRRSLVVVISDFLATSATVDDIIDALQHLLHNKHEVLVFHLCDYEYEVRLQYESRPVKFVDMEQQREVLLNPFEVRAVYEKIMTDYIRRLAEHCTKYRIDFVEVDIIQKADQILKPYLTKRKAMM